MGKPLQIERNSYRMTVYFTKSIEKPGCLKLKRQPGKGKGMDSNRLVNMVTSLRRYDKACTPVTMGEPDC